MTPNQEPVERWEDSIREAMVKDFKELYQKEFTTDWKAQRFVRELEIRIMGVSNIGKLIAHQKALSRAEVLEEVRGKIEKLPDKQNDEFGEITISYSDTLVVVDEMKGDL